MAATSRGFSSCPPGAAQLALCPFEQQAEGVVPEPEPCARTALEDRELLSPDLAADEVMPIPAGRAVEIGLAPRVEIGHEPGSAMMAKARPVADASQAVRANGVEIALVQREAGLAIGAAVRFVVAARGAARRTAHDARLVPARLLDGDDLAAMAAKAAADRALGRIVLPAALRAFDEEAHGEHPGELSVN